MADLAIRIGDLRFTARWEEAAPLTRAALRTWLPIRSRLIHCRWSGESTWIPFGESRPDVGFENHTSHPAPGALLIYVGDLSECELLFPYGACMFNSKLGQLAGNHFATVVQGAEQLAELGRRTLWEGAQEIEITEVGASLDRPGAEVVDGAGLLVLPGVIDVHTHLRLPVPDRPDRFAQDTMAAGLGGTTTVLTFNNPGTGISESGTRSPLRGLEEFRERTAGESAIDYGLCAVLTGHQDDPIGELAALIDAGVPSFKAFMVYDFRLPDEDLERAMRVAAGLGGMLQVHCEQPTIIDPLVAEALARGDTGPRHHALTRPAAAEAEATRRAIDMARRADAPLYVVHLSCEAALEAVADAKARGEPVYAETCPHYLTLTNALYDHPDDGEVVKRVISPPLRSRGDVDALWAGLREGVLDVVASDHVPDRLDTEKRLPLASFPEISNGGPGIETLLALVYSEGVAKGRIGLERMVEVLSSTPARVFGLEAKGEVAVGADADLVLLDPVALRTLRQADLHHTSDYTPFEGMELRGEVRDVLLRGRRVTRGRGRFIERQRTGSGRQLA
ncbi:MAG: dihydropyrimidinase [Chloroflexi bacterium]|nr:dihydropyrimidinase [Chloroflexota bacterium]